MNIVLIGNSAKCSRDAFDELRNALEKKHQVTAASFESNKILPYSNGAQCVPDVAIVLGGDGTIISAAHYFGLTQIPIIGINLGKLGYLANFSYDDFLEQALADTWPQMLYCTEAPPSERLILETIMHDGGVPHDVRAVNDFVIDIGHPFRTIVVRIHVNGKWLTDVRGDGVIVSTPTGSTAYNLSAGGPILQPESEVIAITPKNPHSLSFRPLVVHGSSIITLTVKEPEGAHVIVDGQKVVPMVELSDSMGNGSRSIEIGPSRAKLKLVRNGFNRHQEYWEILRTKLKWGV